MDPKLKGGGGCGCGRAREERDGDKSGHTSARLATCEVISGGNPSLSLPESTRMSDGERLTWEKKSWSLVSPEGKVVPKLNEVYRYSSCSSSSLLGLI